MQLSLKPIDMPRELRQTPPRERDIIAGRIASAQYWQRRHRMLKLRAALFGRRKTARMQRPALAPVQATRAA